MSLEIVRAWVNSLPEIEHDMPVIRYAGRVYTPREILQLAENEELPDEIQEMIERRQFTTAEDVYLIGLERVKKYLSSLPEDMIIYFGTQPYRVAELLQEVEKATPVGRAFVEAEIRKWERIYRE